MLANLLISGKAQKMLQRRTGLRMAPQPLKDHRTYPSSLSSSLSTDPAKDSIPTSSHRSIISTHIEAITITYWMEYYVTDLTVATFRRFHLTFCRLVGMRIRTNIQSVQMFGFKQNSRHDSTCGTSWGNRPLNMTDITNRSYGSQIYLNISWTFWIIMTALVCRIFELTSSLGFMTSMDKTLLSKRGWLSILGQTSAVP